MDDIELTPGQQEAADSAERKKRAQPNDTPSTDYDPDPSRKDRPSKSYGVGEGDQQSNAKPSLDYMRHFTQPDILAVGHNPGMKGTMEEFKAGTLHSGSKKGPVVKSRKQAIAIGLSQQRRGK
jgi:hypothetical protein